MNGTFHAESILIRLSSKAINRTDAQKDSNASNPIELYHLLYKHKYSYFEFIGKYVLLDPIYYIGSIQIRKEYSNC